jgi:membrane protein
MKPRALYELVEETLIQWWNENTSTLGAALAYYAVFALAPLAVLAVTISSYLFGKHAAQGELYRRLESTIGPAFAQAIQDSIQYSNRQGGGFVATVISVGVILFGAVNLFNQLQHSLNTIWGVQPRAGRSWWQIIKARLMPFVVMLLVSLLLLASLISSTIMQTLGNQIADLGIPGEPLLWRFLNWLISLVLITVVFALIYRILPDVDLRWRDVLIGATLTTVLFLIGNFLIGLYLSRSGTTSAYGAAGSLVVILLWVYYSSQVLLFGAEFTQVYAAHYGSPRMSASAEAMTAGTHRKAVCRQAETARS